MSKRIIAMICLCAMLLGFVPATANAAVNQYQVGYSKKNINPIIQNEYTGDLGIPAQYKDSGVLKDYTDLAEHKVMTKVHTGTNTEEYVEIPIVNIPLRGYGGDSRFAKYLTDDNGDGLIHADKDGLFVTATFVTDVSGNSVVYLTMDVAAADSSMLFEVRNRVYNALHSSLPNLQPNHILLSASHSHASFQSNELYTVWKAWTDAYYSKAATSSTQSTLYGAYYEYIIAQATQAVVDAYNDRASADMSKGEIDASEAMKEMGYVYTDNSKAHYTNYGEGYQMNFNRHYNVKWQAIYEASKNSTGVVYESRVNEYNYVVGDNFNKIPTNRPLFERYLYKENAGFTNTGRYYDYYEASHVSESDDTLQILRFSRSGKNDVLMIDWRAHVALNGNSNLFNISSDYVNALRYYLEQAGFCVGFWQGASGNINPNSSLSWELKYDPDPAKSVGWPSVVLEELKTPKVKDVAEGSFYDAYYSEILEGYESYNDRFYRAGLYGYLLGKIAEKCLAEKMTGTLDMSEIKVLTFSYRYTSQQYSDDWKTATQNWKNATDVTYPYATTVNGKTYVINSSFHSNKLNSRLLVDSNWNGAQRSFAINVVVMGKNVGLVTGSGEMFDYYDANGSTAAADNDWRELDAYLESIGLQYGRLFAVSYTNADTGYLPNSLAYDYRTLSNSACPDNAQPSGSYEVNTSEFNKGTGEKVIELYKTMITRVSGDDAFKVSNCVSCGKDVVWTPYYQEMVNADFSTGHYYLAEDLNGQNSNASKEIGTAAASSTYFRYQQAHPETVHLDLNGHSFYNNGRCFYMRRYGSLMIMDSVGGGQVQGTTAGSNPVGGTFTGEGNSTIDLYGGTYSFNALSGHSSPTYDGGVIELRGNLYVRSGVKIIGGTVTSTSTKTAHGGAINAYSGAKVYIYSGAEVTSGSVVGNGYGPCIYAGASYNSDGTVANTAIINLYSTAKVDDIYFEAAAPSALYIGGWFSGRLGVTLPGTFTEDTQIGTIAADKHIQEVAAITVNAQGVNRLRDESNKVYLNVADSDEVAFVGGSRGGTAYSSLQAAVTAAAGKTVKLSKDIANDITLTTDAVIDLNGHSVTGVLNTAADKTIKLFDSATDDFDVADGVYGKVKITDANKNQIKAMSEEDGITEDGYLMINEGEYASFHRVQVKINSMSLRPAQAGLYYNSSFAGDQVVADLINNNGNNEVKFGVALSLKGQPTANNLETDCLYSKFTGFNAGVNGNSGASSSTLLVNVINTDRADFVNNEYAKMSVYGRPFIVLPNGQYYFGKIVARSLRQQVEATDTVWNQLNYSQSNSFRSLYETYQSTMGNWNVANVKANCKFTDSKDVIKILEIGNSHGLDSTNMLVEVIKKENPNAKVIVGALYKSGCRLEEHYNFMFTNSASYSYHKNATFTEGVSGINTDGSWKVTKNATALYGLQDEDWDIITLQQMNHWSGRDYLYITSQMNYIVDYIKNNKQNPANEPILMWNMIWANPQGDIMTNRDQYDKNWSGNHAAFKDESGKYNTDVLFANIARCTQTHVMSRGDFADVLPVGTAIQYALKQFRTENKQNKTAEEIAAGAYQDLVYRDYTHVNDYGRLMIAYVWYAKIFGIDKFDKINVTEIPANIQYETPNYPTDRIITSEMQEDLIEAVNWAIKNPYTIG